jgi:hypothetical protein
LIYFVEGVQFLPISAGQKLVFDPQFFWRSELFKGKGEERDNLAYEIASVPPEHVLAGGGKF